MNARRPWHDSMVHAMVGNASDFHADVVPVRAVVLTKCGLRRLPPPPFGQTARSCWPKTGELGAGSSNGDVEVWSCSAERSESRTASAHNVARTHSRPTSPSGSHGKVILGDGKGACGWRAIRRRQGRSMDRLVWSGSMGASHRGLFTRREVDARFATWSLCSSYTGTWS